MVYPASVTTRQVSVGAPRDSQWNLAGATVILTPDFSVAVDLLGGDVIRGTPITVTLTPTAPTQTVQLLCSDTPGLSVTSFDWLVTYLFPADGVSRSFRVRIPTWTGTGTAPVLDLDLVAPVTMAGVPITSVPVVTPDQLAAALASLAPTGGGYAATLVDASLGDAFQPGTAQTVPGGAFTAIALPSVASDPGGNFSAGSGLYTVPSTGLYSILAKLRPVDGQITTQNNLGMGVHTSLVDHPSFQWNLQVASAAGSANRHTFNYQRVGFFTTGAQLRLYAYVDGVASLPIMTAQLTVLRVA